MLITRSNHVLHTLFVRPALFHASPSLLRQNRLLLLPLVSFLLFSLGACSMSPAPPRVSPKASVPIIGHLSPTSTPLPAGRVLYQADWSHGLTGWMEQGWKVAQGHLMNDSSGTAAFIIPYQLTVSDYAVEIRVQVVRSMPPYGGDYEISARKLPGKDGYHAGILDLKAPSPRPFGDHPQSQALLDPAGDMSPGSGMPQDYEPGSRWHIYRVEVQGNEVRLLDDGTQIGRASSQQTNTLSNGPIEFKCTRVLLHVSDLRILTL